MADLAIDEPRRIEFDRRRARAKPAIIGLAAMNVIVLCLWLGLFLRSPEPGLLAVVWGPGMLALSGLGMRAALVWVVRVVDRPRSLARWGANFVVVVLIWGLGAFVALTRDEPVLGALAAGLTIGVGEMFRSVASKYWEYLVLTRQVHGRGNPTPVQPTL